MLALVLFVVVGPRAAFGELLGELLIGLVVIGRGGGLGILGTVPRLLRPRARLGPLPT